MRVALTGASGFTGRYVQDALIASGMTCIPFEVELLDREAIERAVAETPFDCLIHLAAIAFVNSQDWEAFYTVNQIGTFRLLDAVARSRPGIRCILASSAQVYGSGAAGLVAEDAPAEPANHYAISKRAMEQGADLWRDRLEIVVARPFNYTGVGQGAEYLVPKIVDHFRRGARAIELGNTWVKRDIGDVRSVASAYAGLAAAASVPATINLCTGRVTSIDEIMQMLSDISGHRMDVCVNPAFVRANDIPVLGGDAALLRTTLPSWQPRDLSDTLAWMYQS